MPAQRNSYTFKEGLTMMAAKAIGVDPYMAAEAGETARAAINAIRNAAKSKQPKDRAGYIREAQSELRTISAAKHPKLVNALQAKMLALQGRGGDTEVAHLTPGEMVLPRSLQTPELMKQIAALAARQGIDPARLSVGHRANSVNPRTGAREFDEEQEEIKVITYRPQVHESLNTGLGGDGFDKYGGNSNGGTADGGPGWGGSSEREAKPVSESELADIFKQSSEAELTRLKRALEDGSFKALLAAGVFTLAAGTIALLAAPEAAGFGVIYLVGAHILGAISFGADRIVTIIDRVIEDTP